MTTKNYYPLRCIIDIDVILKVYRHDVNGWQPLTFLNRYREVSQYLLVTVLYVYDLPCGMKQWRTDS